MNSITRHDLVEICGAVLCVYFIMTAIMVMIMERLCIDTETAMRVAPVILPVVIAIIMLARILDGMLRASIGFAARCLRITRSPARREE